MDLLFDEHCSGNYSNNKAEIDKNHRSNWVGHNGVLPAGTKDEEILQYAKKNNLTIVTKDVRFVKLCSEKNAKVAVLKGNYLFLIEKAVSLFSSEPESRLFTYD